MTDRELIERAAKAHGRIKSDLVELGAWNPLTDDGDALRLAVKLEADVTFEDGHVLALIICQTTYKVFGWREKLTDDKTVATRRAIVRAAAAMAEEG
jgi:hypothetical protein